MGLKIKENNLNLNQEINKIAQGLTLGQERAETPKNFPKT